METKEFTYQNTTLQYLKKDNQAIKNFVLIHGYGASMHDLFDLHQFCPDFNGYFPNGPMSLGGGMMMARAWFPIDEMALQKAMMAGTHRDLAGYEPEGLDQMVDVIEAFVRENIEGKVVLGGFSQGAMLATHLIGRLQDKISGLVLFSGNLVDQDRLAQSLNEMHSTFPVFQSHGTSDPILGFSGALNLKNLLEQSGLDVELHEFSGQHEIPMDILRHWSSFMQRLEFPRDR